MPCYQVFAFVVLAISYLSTYRITVYVHIERAHKYGNLDTAIRKCFICLPFFDGNHFSICRGHNSIIVDSMLSFGNTKKRYHKEQQTKRNYKYYGTGGW